MKQTFVDLLRESTIMQGVITIMVLSVWLYMITIGASIPPALEHVCGLVIGFFFGGKYALAAMKAGEREIQ